MIALRSLWSESHPISSVPTSTFQKLASMHSTNFVSFPCAFVFGPIPGKKYHLEDITIAVHPHPNRAVHDKALLRPTVHLGIESVDRRLVLKIELKCSAKEDETETHHKTFYVPANKNSDFREYAPLEFMEVPQGRLCTLQVVKVVGPKAKSTGKAPARSVIMFR